MIYRLKHLTTNLDFGSQQAALQLLDNYPPHLRIDVAVQEITLDELNEELSKLQSEMSKHSTENTHTEWLVSRIEFYSAALPVVEQSEQMIANKLSALPTIGE